MNLRTSLFLATMALGASIATGQGGLTWTFDYTEYGRPTYFMIQSTNPCWQTIEILGVTAVEHGMDHATFHDLVFTTDASNQWAEATWTPPALPRPPDDMTNFVIVYIRYYDECYDQWVYIECSADYL